MNIYEAYIPNFTPFVDHHTALIVNLTWNPQNICWAFPALGLGQRHRAGCIAAGASRAAGSNGQGLREHGPAGRFFEPFFGRFPCHPTSSNIIQGLGHV